MEFWFSVIVLGLMILLNFAGAVTDEKMGNRIFYVLAGLSLCGVLLIVITRLTP